MLLLLLYLYDFRKALSLCPGRVPVNYVTVNVDTGTEVRLSPLLAGASASTRAGRWLCSSTLFTPLLGVQGLHT